MARHSANPLQARLAARYRAGGFCRIIICFCIIHLGATLLVNGKVWADDGAVESQRQSTLMPFGDDPLPSLRQPANVEEPIELLPPPPYALPSTNQATRRTMSAAQALCRCANLRGLNQKHP